MWRKRNEGGEVPQNAAWLGSFCSTENPIDRSLKGNP